MGEIPAKLYIMDHNMTEWKFLLSWKEQYFFSGFSTVKEGVEKAYKLTLKIIIHHKLNIEKCHFDVLEKETFLLHIDCKIVLM